MRARKIGVHSLMILCLLAGCSFLAPQPDRSRYFVLTPVAPVGAGGEARRLALGVGPVTLPGYLSRPEIVRRSGENQLVVSQTGIWGEPLERSVRLVVSENLRRLVGGVEIIQYPWFTTATIDYQIPIQVLRFEADKEGTVSLDARWRIRRRGTSEPPHDSESRIVKPAADSSTESMVAAMSEALGTLSQEIAAGIR